MSSHFVLKNQTIRFINFVPGLDSLQVRTARTDTVTQSATRSARSRRTLQVREDGLKSMAVVAVVLVGIPTENLQ